MNNSNPIEELRNLQIPVSEQEWESIVHDKRYVKKFGRKPKWSPGGRAALILGTAAVLVAIPILVKNLTHKVDDIAQNNQPVVEVTEPQTVTENNTPIPVTPASQNPTVTPVPEVTYQMLPTASDATAQTATHEQSTLTSVTEARIPATSTPAPTSNPLPISASVSQPTERPATPPEKSANIATTENRNSRPNIAENRPQSTNSFSDDDWSMTEKSPEETEADVDEFFIPSAFTPNGDGLNDLFHVMANFEPRSFEMSILNRGGDLVFLTRDMGIGWDGQFHGQTLPNGVYVYIIKYTDRQGNIQKKQGQVLLLP